MVAGLEKNLRDRDLLWTPVVSGVDLRVAEAQLMQDRGVQVGGADAVLDGLRRHLRLRFG